MTGPATPVFAASHVSRPAGVFLVIGCCSVVAGGMVAAVTGPWNLDYGSWLAAYLVLVCGVAQCAIGVAQAWLTGLPITSALEWTQVSCWNLGNAAVIAGTLASVPVLVDAGGVLLALTFGIAALVFRRPAPRLIGWVYRGVLAVLFVSIPIGIVLAHLRDTR